MTDLIETAAATNLTDQNLPDQLPPRSKRSNLIKLPKKILKDRTIKKLLKDKTRAAPGQRYTIWDGELPGFGVRVTDKHLSYIYAGRFPGSKHWTRREIGAVDAMTLAAARDTARDWIKLLAKGVDPAAEMERLAQEQARKRADTFSAVAESYIAEKVIGPNPARPLMRKARVTTQIIRKVFIATWKERPVASIDRNDVLVLIRAKKRLHPAEARSWLSTIKSLFTWALDQSYGLDRSPCSDIKPSSAIGERNPRDRALDDTEVRALWRAADQSEYPVKPIYQMLLLSGLRLNEVAKANWSEFDPAKRQWVIPAARMKGKNTGSKKAVSHLVPLTPSMIEILDTLPRFNGGDLLFSTTHGRKPFWMGSKVKNDIDAKMLVELRRIAQQRGNDPQKVKLEEWVNHDIRRTVRTNLSALKVKQEVAEAILAHKQGGIVGTYDVYSYSDEKREALELWAARLREIVNPPQPEPDKDSNVVDLRRKAGRR
jgi:integrase